MTYKYSAFFLLVYRFGNIPANILMIFYILTVAVDLSFIRGVYLIILGIALVAINKYFIFLYRFLPAEITVEGDGIRAKRFFLSKREVFVRFSEITELKGGVFDERFAALIKVYTKEGMLFCFFQKMKDSKELQNTLLQKINKSLYNDIITRIGLKEKLNK